jgi:oligoribonuclease NrnB/cAMP/cGMP phosphodiesterase (DHH superfamily)
MVIKKLLENKSPMFAYEDFIKEVNSKPILFTHIDFDGFGCEVIFRAVFGREARVIRLNYDTVDVEVMKFIDTDDMIYIADLSVTPENTELLSHRGNVLIFDHHVITSQTHTQYDFIYYDSISGTEILYKYLLKTNPSLKKYEDFVTIVTDYDTWVHKYVISKQFNMLLWSTGWDRFIDRMLTNPSIEFTVSETAIIQQKTDSRNEVITAAMKTAKFVNTTEGPAKLVVSSQYKSDIGHLLAKSDDVLFGIIINSKTGEVSLRTDNKINLNDIARKFGGGGHQNAAGFGYKNPEDLKTFIPDIENTKVWPILLADFETAKKGENFVDRMNVGYKN